MIYFNFLLVILVRIHIVRKVYEAQWAQNWKLKWCSGKESVCDTGDPGLISGSEDPLEKGMATHSSILAWEIQWTDSPWGCKESVRHDCVTNTHMYTEVSPLDSAVYIHGKWKVVDQFSFHFFLKIREYWGQRAELIQMENISNVERVRLYSSSVQSLSCVWLFVTLWTAACRASLSITNSWSLLKLMSIELVMPSNQVILCCPLLLPSIFPSIGVSSDESVLRIKWPNISVSASASVLPVIIQNWFPLGWTGLINLAVQETVKRLLQHHSSKASILWRSAFFIVQLSHPYMTTGKTIALARWTFVGKVMSLLLNLLSRLVIAFLPRSTRLLISWLQSPFAVILEPLKIKSVTVFPSICYEVMGPYAMILVFWMLSFKPTFSLSSLTFLKRLFSSSSLSDVRVVSSAYLRLLIFLLAIMVPACASSCPPFCMISSISIFKSDYYFVLLLLVIKKPKTWSIELKHWNFTWDKNIS